LRFSWFKDTDGGKIETVEIGPNEHGFEIWPQDGFFAWNHNDELYYPNIIESRTYRIRFECPAGRGVADMAIDFTVEDLLVLLQSAIRTRDRVTNSVLEKIPPHVELIGLFARDWFGNELAREEGE